MMMTLMRRRVQQLVLLVVVLLEQRLQVLLLLLLLLVLVVRVMMTKRMRTLTQMQQVGVTIDVTVFSKMSHCSGAVCDWGAVLNGGHRQLLFGLSAPTFFLCCCRLPDCVVLAVLVARPAEAAAA
jgi:hypothetical protein